MALTSNSGKSKTGLQSRSEQVKKTPTSIPFERYVALPIPKDPWTVWSIQVHGSERSHKLSDSLEELTHSTFPLKRARLLPASL
ncbi:uncharacterized protein Z518_04989 [Rhinocladiella mackenziei CBS 650.93]|uniref:Rhinocladiella mackenziei CBS 650.93 unplaced genomic scaffold supercont1.3, whole genome shotgun sequence n=1 Tax=Rhinocladiella mackenziei CBS 650.93 TaxID=1442369 RepID=A0A0D2H976_9EURO|nr:uncharacterized protein Z518_04989 [Rhinocladiella mackenziei CBS 650.93]KIX07013.1 hypothetical protein Z518_04989 [Rhinocladiella mackenziei CBS 650.93]